MNIETFIIMGLIGAGAWVYVWVIAFSNKSLGKRYRKAIDAFAPAEHRALLKERLLPDKKESPIWYVWLVVSVATLYGVWQISLYGNEAGVVASGIGIFGGIAHIAFLLLIGGIWLFERKEMKDDPFYRMPSLSNYLTDEEAFFLFWTVGEAPEYDSEFLDGKILVPEKLIPLLQNRELVTKCAEMHLKLDEAIEGRVEHLSPDQLERHQQMTEDLRKKTGAFITFARDMKDATSKKEFEKKQKEQVDKQAVQADFAVVQAELEQEMQILESKAASVLPVERATMPGAMQELHRVAESTTLPKELKAEAATLIAHIEEKLVLEKKQTSLYMDELDAIAILKASQQLYRISDSDLQKGTPLEKEEGDARHAI